MYRFELINEEYFDQIIQWKYPDEFVCYDMEDKLTTINQLFDKEGYDFFVGINLFDEIVGYMECFFKDDMLEVGQGLNPVMIGQGLSYDFISESIEYAVEYYGYTGDAIRILVEPFNKRAMRVYLRVGFVVVEKTDEFIMMELER
ncbi:MAG: GNAT family N-acetyltransferase [Clostridiales bacterium]|nr:GNAT family N-acetyltransferase [Clostridiales bacterium]